MAGCAGAGELSLFGFPPQSPSDGRRGRREGGVSVAILKTPTETDSHKKDKLPQNKQGSREERREELSNLEKSKEDVKWKGAVLNS